MLVKRTASQVVWIPDTDVQACMSCAKAFTFTRRRHHCRRCGKVFCSLCCSSFVRFHAASGYSDPVRVCNFCRSKALALPDLLVQYIQSFLGDKEQCRMLRVCKRLQRLVILPYDKVQQSRALNARFRHFDEPDSVVADGDSWRMCRCVDSTTGCSRMLKVVRKDRLYSRRQWQALQREINCLTMCSHPSCPNLFEVLQTPYEVVLVLEWYEGVLLSDLLAARVDSALPEPFVAHITFQLLKVLQYMHQRLRLAFRGLTSDNVLLVRDGTAPLKLLDFSQCKAICRPKAEPAALVLGETPPSTDLAPSFGQCSTPCFATASPNSPRTAFADAVDSSPPLAPQSSSGSVGAAGSPQSRRRRVPINTANDALWDGHQPSKMARTRQGGIRQPPSIAIPGGRDEELLRRCAQLARAARAREANASFAVVVGQAFSSPAAERLVFGDGCGKIERPATDFDQPPMEHEIKLSPRASSAPTQELGYDQGPSTSMHGPRCARNITVRTLLSADVWHVGALVHRMLVGSEYEATGRRGLGFDDPKWEDVSAAAKLLVSTMLSPEPSERPSVGDTLLSDWFRDGTMLPCDELLDSAELDAAPAVCRRESTSSSARSLARLTSRGRRQ